jgi:hypothetical protein
MGSLKSKKLMSRSQSGARIGIGPDPSVAQTLTLLSHHPVNADEVPFVVKE